MNTFLVKAKDFSDAKFLITLKELQLLIDGINRRKHWEWVKIAQAFQSLQAKSETPLRCLGFGVGKEPLVSLFAAMGADVVATDQPDSFPRAIEDWGATGQLATSLADCFDSRICPRGWFDQNVTFEFADMNNVPEKYHGQFDFVWSASSLDHLGSIEKGRFFIEESVRCLRAGGLAVHTTEFSLSKHHTVSEGTTVFFREYDLRECLSRYDIECDFTRGNEREDIEVDFEPCQKENALVIEAGGCIITSVLVVIPFHAPQVAAMD